MSPVVLISGPDHLLTFKSPRAPEELQGRATTHIHEQDAAFVTAVINGDIQEVEAFEEIEVSEPVLEVLEHAGIEIEVVETTNVEEE
jgi:hypothetical protein